jgi:hypothetical protein
MKDICHRGYRGTEKEPIADPKNHVRGLEDFMNSRKAKGLFRRNFSVLSVTSVAENKNE